MSAKNNTTDQVFLLNQQIFQDALTKRTISRVSFVIIISLIFIYLNAIMVYTLWSKPVFKETPRYILFKHMLINDLIQLFVTSLLYVFIQTSLKLVMAACAFIVIVSSTTFRNAPFNLAVMSLERYVAISFPLRHAEIATQKRTHIAIGIIWFMGMAQYVTDLFYSAVSDPKFLTSQTLCTRERLFIRQWQVDLHQGVIIFFFVSVTVIILFTYVSLLITMRSISSNKESARKAHKTVLLHIFQLGLCLTSFLYSIIDRALAMTSNDSSLFLDLQYLVFLFVLILPRCLSPLIYGLRDDAVRPIFMYYFCCVTGKCTSAVNVH